MTLLMRLTVAAVSATQHRFFASHGDHTVDAPVPRGLRRSCRVERRELGGSKPGAGSGNASPREAGSGRRQGRAPIAVTSLTPRRGATDTEILYFHGGSYNAAAILPHWWLVGGLISRTGATVHVPSYPLAPAHTADEAYPVIDAVTDEIVGAGDSAAGPSDGARSGRLAFVGDSAGGAIALVEAMRLRDAGRRAPDAVALFSPWVDATMANDAAREVQEKDPSLDVDLLAEAATWWAGERDTADPLISPTFGTLEGLPPVTVVQGGRDVFAPDVDLFVAKLRAAGVPTGYVRADDGFHVYPAARWVPESKKALRVVAAAILGRAPGARRPEPEGCR
ncbi:alpha/beta hydrolase fold domain-containing protein [Dietzia sp.]|uniref:alpha/beta hydrolase fold domain-containing protein n=1 Tax=Dietzia sp. TaxID=1871616 RepID=UPI002FD935AE